MGTLVRNNAWNSNGDFSNQDLFWYAKGVGKMMQRGLNDPASWWFFAAIHGEYVNPANAWYPNPPAFPAWGDITSPPSVPTTPLPNQSTQDSYWNQCQHGSWYFLPWHRGYLIALEAQLRADIQSLGGPSTWALPYWNYFGGAQGVQAVMPPAFGEKTLPDGSANPLYVAMRYGPDASDNIYIPTVAWRRVFRLHEQRCVHGHRCDDAATRIRRAGHRLLAQRQSAREHGEQSARPGARLHRRRGQ
jgi:tyrosinase